MSGISTTIIQKIISDQEGDIYELDAFLWQLMRNGVDMKTTTLEDLRVAIEYFWDEKYMAEERDFNCPEDFGYHPDRQKL